MEKRTFKDNIYTAIAGLTKAFSSPKRLEIIDLLANGEKSVEQIAVQTAISVANASQHLQVLKNARLTKTRREGNFIYYALNPRFLQRIPRPAKPSHRIAKRNPARRGAPHSFLRHSFLPHRGAPWAD